MEYVKNMGGVDVSDQRLGSHAHKHRPRTYFWRRVFDQKFAQATSNAYLVFVKWVEMLLRQCEEALEERGEQLGLGGAAGGGGNSDLSDEELQEFQGLLTKVLKMERVKWDQKLAKHLISQCNVGNAAMGGRRKRKADSTWSGNASKNSRVCNGGQCKQRANQEAGSKSRTLGVCWCNICTRKQGKTRALTLCKTCNKCEAAHVTAANVADGHQSRHIFKGVDWVYPPSSP